METERRERGGLGTMTVPPAVTGLLGAMGSLITPDVVEFMRDVDVFVGDARLLCLATKYERAAARAGSKAKRRKFRSRARKYRARYWNQARRLWDIQGATILGYDFAVGDSGPVVAMTLGGKVRGV